VKVVLSLLVLGVSFGAPASEPTEPPTCASDIAPTTKVDPRYPIHAWNDPKVPIVIQLRVVIGSDGVPLRIQSLNHKDFPDFSASARRAVSKWRYPAQSEPCLASVEITFVLSE
jgi:hypothetical protein